MFNNKTIKMKLLSCQHIRVTESMDGCRLLILIKKWISFTYFSIFAISISVTVQEKMSTQQNNCNKNKRFTDS